VTSGLLGGWLSDALKDNEVTNEINLRTSSLKFLSLLWYLFPSKISAYEEVANLILSSLQRCARCNNKSLSLVALSEMFALLEHLTGEKDKYASVI